MKFKLNPIGKQENKALANLFCNVEVGFRAAKFLNCRDF